MYVVACARPRCLRYDFPSAQTQKHVNEKKRKAPSKIFRHELAQAILSKQQQQLGTAVTAPFQLYLLY